MQKYGILRLYCAKARSGTPPPGWVDRLLVLAWFPLYLVWLAPRYRDDVELYFPTAKAYTLPLIDAIEAGGTGWVLPAAAVVAFSLAAFLFFEWENHRLGNTPRLTMALGTTALGASFLICSSVNVFLAFAFSHAVENMVFVWAFQRRRYRAPCRTTRSWAGY
ncbi:hypothetical protein [Thiocapsa sp.]|uniref:hypothetical protein n=1 Tax=Thiocapsa sp. TaxID=2024551 RepID=UPI0035947CC4